ncbi:MAG: SGNH/GDSL hydrolase family protein [Steroidobacteraceae bacterium]
MPSGSKYVSMGSSYAAGPGIGISADTPANRCQRSNDNYAHQLARRRQLQLVDVSCGGATTANILGPWNELPAQVDAVDADTRLVTITIGGNDIGFVGSFMPVPATCGSIANAASTAGNCPPPRSVPNEEAYAALETRMAGIATEIHRRAPSALVVFVDYPRVLPDGALCPALPLSEAQTRESRELARRLSDLTKRAAQRSGSMLIEASKISRNHDACAKDPWMNGVINTVKNRSSGQFVPVHPTIKNMTAIAEALDRVLK